MSKVVVLKKRTGHWTDAEIEVLVKKCVAEVRVLSSMPKTLVIANIVSEKDVRNALGHAGFTYELVDYADRPF